MNKSDLKDGMVVTIRGGNQCILIEGNLFKNNFTLDSTTFNYNEDLTSKKNKNYDIVKVFDIGKTKELWKREEIDWSKIPVGTKVLVSDTKMNWFNGIFLKKTDFINDGVSFKVANNCGDVEGWKYCKLAEEPKEEVTSDDIEKEMKSYCKKHNKSCYRICEICTVRYILDNYNLTRKDNK